MKVYVLINRDTGEVDSIYKHPYLAASRLIYLMKEKHMKLWKDYLEDYECEEDLENDIFNGLDCVDEYGVEEFDVKDDMEWGY